MTETISCFYCEGSGRLPGPTEIARREAMTEASDTVSVTRGDWERALNCLARGGFANLAHELSASLSAPPAPQGERVERVARAMAATSANMGRFVHEEQYPLDKPIFPSMIPYWRALADVALRFAATATAAPEADINELVAKIEAKCNGRVWLARDVYGAWDVRCEYPGGDHYCGTGPDLLSALQAAARQAGEG
jgi:hypothetical protein